MLFKGRAEAASALAAPQAASCSLFLTVNSSRSLKQAPNRDGAGAEDVAPCCCCTGRGNAIKLPTELLASLHDAQGEARGFVVVLRDGRDRPGGLSWLLFADHGRRMDNCGLSCSLLSNCDSTGGTSASRQRQTTCESSRSLCETFL